jgi:hypothetical protein
MVPGNPLHNTSIGVEDFISLILTYLSCLVDPVTFYHGRSPLKKYINIYPIDSRSSLLLCSKYF